ncbi:MAG: hypothetical protein JWR26_4216 [Pedosphaera sp.]|nr:hypothetical protein [Pedosphaera sp.]
MDGATRALQRNHAFFPPACSLLPAAFLASSGFSINIRERKTNDNHELRALHPLKHHAKEPTPLLKEWGKSQTIPSGHCRPVALCCNQLQS